MGWGGDGKGYGYGGYGGFGGGKGYGGYGGKGYGGYGGFGGGGFGGGYGGFGGYGGPVGGGGAWDGGKGMMMEPYGMPPMWGMPKGKGKGKGKSPQLKVDPSLKIWIGNIAEGTKWKDLQVLVDGAAKSKWCEIFSGKGKGTAAVVYRTASDAANAISMLNGMELNGQSIVVDSWERGAKN